MASLGASFAKKIAENHARALAAKAQNKAKQYAAQKARQVANAAKRRANAGITSIVQRHMGNNAQSRALANKLKAHVSNKINLAHAKTQNQIKAAPSFKLF
jgi:uncharacterized protein YpuA (DUF1002 family)